VTTGTGIQTARLMRASVFPPELSRSYQFGTWDLDGLSSVFNGLIGAWAFIRVPGTRSGWVMSRFRDAA
jgi:hypothetical protein